MLDKFLNKINHSSVTSSIHEKIADYNKEVLEIKKREPTEKFIPRPEQIFQSNKFQKYPKFEKSGANFSRPNTYQTFENKERKEYIDDGSYFCSYAIGGNTLVCYKNKDKVELVLDKILHPDKNNYLAKRANYFLNDLVKKKKVYIEEMENGKYEIFLDSEKTESINSILINEGFDNSESKKPSTDLKNNVKEDKDVSVEVVKKEKINYAYGLFAKDYNTFEALFDNKKITLELADVNLDLISKEDQKTCKSMIYEFVSKKNIILQFIKEENGVHFVRVSNKEGKCLNDLVLAKKFNAIDNNHDADSINNTNQESCSEDDWDFAGTNKKENDNSEDKDIHEVSSLPAMFNKPLESKPNSPFAKKKVADKVISPVENFGEEQDIHEVSSLPAMFNKPLESKPNSPFAKKKVADEVIISPIENFAEEQDIHEVSSLPTMFNKPLESKPNSPFAKKNVLQSEDNTSNVEDVVVTVKKKLSFGKR